MQEPTHTDSEFERYDYSYDELAKYKRIWGNHFLTFLRGLYEWRITFKTFHEEMRYFGGDQPDDSFSEAHWDYYINEGGNPDDMPEKEEYCICGTNIVQQCYIVYKNDVHGLKSRRYVIGNECVKKYIALENRTKNCKKCKRIHEDLKSSYCMECRKVCRVCGETKHNVVEAGTCKKCQNEHERNEMKRKIEQYAEEQREIRRKECEIAEQARIKHEAEQREIRRKEYEIAEQNRIKRETENRIKMEVLQREQDEAYALAQYLQKCECGKPTYKLKKCKSCYLQSFAKCEIDGCNQRLTNPNYTICYMCNKIKSRRRI